MAAEKPTTVTCGLSSRTNEIAERWADIHVKRAVQRTAARDMTAMNVACKLPQLHGQPDQLHPEIVVTRALRGT